MTVYRPEPIPLTPIALAGRYIGIQELAGAANHPLIQWWLSLCSLGLNTPDEVPWCSAFLNGICWELGLPRSKSAAARSWLTVGTPIDPVEVYPGFDVVVLSRGEGPQPPATVLDAPGHVGLVVSFTSAPGSGISLVNVLAGNQGNRVSIAPFPTSRVLGYRRLRVG